MKTRVAAAICLTMMLNACLIELPDPIKDGARNLNAYRTVAVTGVALSSTTATLAVGDTIRLTATVAPDSATNKAVAWTSSRTAVATVANGKVTAVAVGTATIAVTTEDGNKTASCALTVVAVGVPVASVTLNQTTTELTVGDTLTLTATVLPENADNKAVAWASSNNAVATVADGLVTAIAAGTANITVTTEDGSKTASCAVTVGWSTTSFGMASFTTAQTWTVGSQTWSDAVQATGCNKTTFDGYTPDCRSNPGQKGDLFSWYAVDEYKDQLCPNDWRVPTRQDFVDLDIALGGTGNNRSSDLTTVNKYRNSWGGVYGGNCNSGGALVIQGSRAYYWSQSELSSDYAYSLYFYSVGHVFPQYGGNKNYGQSLRCVR